MQLNNLEKQIVLKALKNYKSSCDKVNQQVNIPNVETKYMDALKNLIKQLDDSIIYN